MTHDPRPTPQDPHPTTLTYYGHGCIGLEWDGCSLIIDPFPPKALGGGLDYEPISGDFDYGISTHDHEDHRGFSDIEGVVKRRVDASENVDDICIRRYPLCHDEYGGEIFGGASSVIGLTVNSVNIIHAGDVGRSPSQYAEWMHEPDILCVPVGGCYTIGAAQAFEWSHRLNPAIIIPMHYRVEDKTDIGLGSVEPFLAYFEQITRFENSTIDCEKQLESCDKRSSVVCLTPDC